MKKKKKKYKGLIELLIKVIVLCGIVYVVLTYVVALHRQRGNNMFSSLKDGDGCVFYRLEEVNTSDIVLYKTESGEYRTGRVVAMPGSDVDFPEGGGYTVNLNYPTEEIVYQTYADSESDMRYPVRLQSDEYFIMNDFRSNTKDSRTYGPIKKEQILGKLLFQMRLRNF